MATDQPRPYQPRPVWLTVEQRDYITRWHMTERPLRDIVRAWDAAPADPEEDSANAYLGVLAVTVPAIPDTYVVARAVLRALGMKSDD